MISLVIPVYNEEDSLVPLHEEIRAVAARESLDVEIVFIDDGSSDRSWPIISELSQKDRQVRGIRFRKNFGKAPALAAGFRAARGDVILTLDADLQDDPAELPRFLAALDHGEELSSHKTIGRLDVVSGWKKKRLDPWHKVFPSRIFNRLVGWVTGVRLHDHNCGMKAYRVEVLREVKLYGELHRFIPVLAAARGFKIGELEINHRARKFGHSKYGVRRFVKGFLDLLTVKFLTGFGQRPQHMLGTFGLLFFILGLLGMGWLGVTWMLTQFNLADFTPLHQRPLLIYALGGVLLGAQLMSIGFLAELITAYQSREEDSYSIAERTPDPPSDSGR